MATILPAVTITAAISPAVVGTVFQFKGDIGGGIRPRSLSLQGTFTYGSSGTSVDAYVQTSFDAGVSWMDIAEFHFLTATAIRLYNLSALTAVTSIATPGDGALANNTSVDGFIGSLLRVKYKSSGIYAGGSTLTIDAAGDVRIVPLLS